MPTPISDRLLTRSILPTAVVATSLFAAGVVHPAYGQTTISTSHTYTFADNEALINIGTTYDGSSYTGVHDVYAGAFTTTVDSNGGFLPPTFQSYCVDIANPLDHATPQPTIIQPLDSTFNLGKASINPAGNYGGALAWIYNNFAPTVVGQTEVAAEQTAALQLSMWEVEYNWNGVGLSGIDPTLTTGNFAYLDNPSSTAVTQAIRLDAVNILTTWNGQVDTATLLNSVGYGYQGLTAPAPPPSGVPEPTALALLLAPGSAVLGGIAICRRSRRKA